MNDSATATVGAARYAGSRVNRVEDARLVTGEGTFVDDVSLPGMLHVCFVRSPFARARIRSIDTSAALELPGVFTVLVGADLNPRMHEQWHTAMGKNVPETFRPPLADDEVRHVGDPIAMVVADSRYVAEDGAELVVVDFDVLPAVVDYTAGRDLRRGGSRRQARQRDHRHARPSARRGRGGVRRGRPRGHRDLPPARLRRGADGDAGHRGRPGPFHRRPHDLGHDPGAPRGATVLLAAARPPREPDPRHHARHGRRVRAEGVRAARGDVRDARGGARSRPAQVDRGPQREPDGRRQVPT